MIDAGDLRALALQAANTGDGYVDTATGLVHLSPEGAVLVGLPGLQVPLPLATFIERMHPDDRDRLAGTIARIADEQTPLEVRFRARQPDGSDRWLLGRGLPRDVGSRRLVVGVMVDIHEHVQMEEQLAADHRALAAQRDELARLHEQMHALSARVITAQEEERQRISRQLHDEVGQMLTACVMSLDFAAGDDNPGPVVQEVVDELRRALRQLRDLSLDLRPPMLDAGGLEPALRWLLERICANRALRWDLHVDTGATRPPSAVEVTAFRIVQEATTNVLRHAGAGAVRVRIGVADGELTLRVQDDGVGFDPRAEQRHYLRVGSQGVLNMAERAAIIGGACRVESQPGGGTLVLARLPLQA